MEKKHEVVRSEVTQQEELELVRRPLSDDFIKRLHDNIKTLEAVGRERRVMATKIICDFCDNEIKGDRYKLTMNREGGNLTNEFVGVDLCRDCASKVRDLKKLAPTR